MAEIVAFPTNSNAFLDVVPVDRPAEDRFLLDEGLELLPDFPSIGCQDIASGACEIDEGHAPSSN